MTRSRLRRRRHQTAYPAIPIVSNSVLGSGTSARRAEVLRLGGGDGRRRRVTTSSARGRRGRRPGTSAVVRRLGSLDLGQGRRELGMVVVKPGRVEALLVRARTGPPAPYPAGSVLMLFQISDSTAGVKGGCANVRPRRSGRPSGIPTKISPDDRPCRSWRLRWHDGSPTLPRGPARPNRDRQTASIRARAGKHAPIRLGVRVIPFMRHLWARGASHAPMLAESTGSSVTILASSISDRSCSNA